ncbi:MAG: hypothetical protein HYV09_15275 [Deltaproteobacteria bacterium]|nr:hypothetical protein [Deltaproteobacteria bacterium]
MRTFSFLLASAAALVLGCSAATDVGDEDGEVDTESSEGAASISSTSTYFSVRVDVRRCMFPMCGGFWVKRVNKANTKCFDGRYAKECYVAEMDWSAAGLTSEDVADRGAIVVRGTIGSLEYGTQGTWGVFKPTEVWSAASGSTPSGSFYRVEYNGIMCVRAPCFDKTADKLNSTISRSLSDLDGALGEKAGSAVHLETILAAGTVHNTSNGGRALSTTEFWTRVAHKPVDPSACLVDSDCTMTAYNKPVTSEADCYCAICPTTAMNIASADYFQKTWETHCSAVPLMCPKIMCVMPPAYGCVEGKCSVKPL